jgi:hypothetical protein
MFHREGLAVKTRQALAVVAVKASPVVMGRSLFHGSILPYKGRSFKGCDGVLAGEGRE